MKDLLAVENPDETDLRWPRFVELKQREEQVRQMRTVYEVRQGADRLVNDREARGGQ